MSDRRRKPLPQPPPLKSQSTRRFSGNLESIRAELHLTPAEFKALRIALRDPQQPKTSQHHKEDESWLDWAIRNAKKYGPQLVKLIETAL